MPLISQFSFFCMVSVDKSELRLPSSLHIQVLLLLYYPFIPVVVIPCTKYLCREKNRIKGGIKDSVAIASAPPQLDTAPASPTNVRNALDTL
jgi:hypothetical protein